MKFNAIVEILMWRDEMAQHEAVTLVMELRNRVMGGEDPEDVLAEVGLELDYVYDLI